MKFLTTIFFLLSFTAKAQVGSDSTFLSRLYLPFGVGSSTTDDSKTFSGKVLLSGFERVRGEVGFHRLFNWIWESIL